MVFHELDASIIKQSITVSGIKSGVVERRYDATKI